MLLNPFLNEMLILQQNTGFYSALGHKLSYGVLTRKTIATQTWEYTKESRSHYQRFITGGNK